MASTKAQLAKEKGNTAFKAGDYPQAIGFYSEAIIADRTDATFPLNRAAAYLRLGKNEDAERDCTTVITLNKASVKGLFRRAQARVALGKLVDAQSDLRLALKIEQANDSVKQELTKVETLLVQNKTKKNIRAPLDSTIFPSTSLPVSPKRRRISITIIEPTSKSLPTSKAKVDAITTKLPPNQSTADEFMKPVSSRPLTTVPKAEQPALVQTSSSSIPIVPKQSSFKDAKQVRETNRPSRAGGGIFRSSGENIVYANGEKKKEKIPQAPATTGSELKSTTDHNKPAPVQSKTPMSLFNFTRSWECLASGTVAQRWSLLSEISPQALPALFQTSLEPTLLVSLLATFQSKLKIDPATAPAEDAMRDRARMREYMAWFAKVPRFSFVVMFMSRVEKELAKEVWEGLGVRNGGAAWGIS